MEEGNWFFIIVMLLYYIIPLFLVGLKPMEFWKGLCGGNGIPQPNEALRGFSLFALYIYCGLHFFYNKSIDIALVTLLLGTITVTTLEGGTGIKKKLKEFTSNK